MLQKGKEVPEDIGDTSPLSLLQEGTTLKGACSCRNPTTTKKTPEQGCFRMAGDITIIGLLPKIVSWGQQVWSRGLS